MSVNCVAITMLCKEQGSSCTTFTSCFIAENLKINNREHKTIKKNFIDVINQVNK